MAPIRTGDGTEVVPSGYAEVRAGDGRVFYEAPDITVVDDFEAGIYDDQGQSLADIYNGDLADFTRSTTAPVIQGSYSLKAPAGPTSPNVTSTSGLPNYPQKGDVFSCYVRDGGSARPVLQFGLSSPSDCYAAVVNTDFPRIDIYKNGGYEESGFNLSLSANTWYEIVVEWHDGAGSEPEDTIVFSLYEVDNNGTRGGLKESVDFQDSAHSAQTGIGFRKRSGDGSKITWDSLTIDKKIS